MIRNYYELIQFETFLERYNYLKLRGRVAEETFGYDRRLNQLLYRTSEWRRVRDKVIIRDNACDLGIRDREIFDMIVVHHINPITIEDVVEMRPQVFDPKFLITTTANTHRAIHYSDASILTLDPIERKPGDTLLW